MLGILHFVLPGAEQSQINPPVANAIDEAMAEGRKQRTNGYLADALASFERAVTLAQAAGDTDREARALTSVSAAQVRLLRYSAAVQSSLRAKQLALQAKDDTIAGAAAVNVSAVFEQLGDFDRAKAEAAEAVERLRTSANKAFYARACLSLAVLDYFQKDNLHGEEAFDDAIRAAQNAHDAALEARAWDERGILLLDEVVETHGNNLLTAAGDSLQRAYAIRQNLKDDYSIPLSEEHLAELELQQPHCDGKLALKLIDHALSAPNSLVREGAPYYPIHVRARILQELGDPRALAEFERAVSAAARWRQSALPGDTTNIKTVAKLHDVYADFAQAAADASLQRKDPALARQALEVFAQNRAAGLREQIAASFGQSMQLPEQYFTLLSELRAAQAKVTLGANTSEDRAKLQKLRSALQDLEDKIGLSNRNLNNGSEKNPLKNSLRRIQGKLTEDEVLLSFCLGEKESFLWAVTRQEVNLYKLSGSSEIDGAAKTFGEQVRLGHDAAATGKAFSRALFSQLPTRIWAKPEWLIVGDRELLNQVPFSALPVFNGGRPAFLGTTHNLRFLPSELFLLAPKDKDPRPQFIGIGDPIYNMADSRRPASLSPIAASPSFPHVSLARLVGSGREVRSASKWNGFPSSELLTGADANGERVAAALAKDPAFVHFAVHVVSPEGQPQEAALALSLGKNGIPELLTPEIVATYHVPGSLVVLSGCWSGEGEELPSAGMIGLSRSWLLAGAAAVLVTAWPTVDGSGQFFDSFYRHLQATRAGPIAGRAAIALRQAQLEMQNGSGYRASPAFWAAYSIISKE